MLIDKLLNHSIDNVDANGHQPLRQRLAKAQKFELGPDFAAAAEELGENLKTITDALPYCRLPYPLTWVEVAQQHRPRFRASSIHMPDLQSIPGRVGFLLEADDESLVTFRAYQFWDLVAMPEVPQASHICMDFDPKRFTPGDEAGILESYNKEEEASLIKVDPSPEWLKASTEIRAKLSAACYATHAPFATIGMTDKLSARLLRDVGIVDWSGETVYILAVLALLNTLNATDTLAVEHKKLNKRRAQQKKHPLSDYHILRIHPRLKRWIKGSSDAHGHKELRGHLCRGHFKVRKTGIFFWRPHTRGRGMVVDKTYRVE